MFTRTSVVQRNHAAGATGARAWKLAASILTVLGVAVCGSVRAWSQTPTPKPEGETKPAETKPAADAKPAGAAKPNPKVKIETTLGDIVVELDAEKAPISTDNFLQYVNAKFYDGTIFHRVMPNFMIQGGGYNDQIVEKKEGLRPPIKNEWQNGLKNVRGTIAMARTSAADSATAQFYINVVDNASLDKVGGGGAAYAVFGKVVEGLDNVDKIRNTETKEDPRYPGGKVVPVTTVLIKSIRVVEGAAPAPVKPQG